jgi:hypothetical protein
MPLPLRRRPKPDRRRALELRASCRDGCSEAMMIAHGFTIGQMVELVQASLATASEFRAPPRNAAAMRTTVVTNVCGLQCETVDALA